MGQTASPLIHEQNTQMVGPVGFECPGRGIGHVAEFVCHGADSGAGFFTHIRLTIQCLADGSYGHTAMSGDILHGNHRTHAPFTVLKRNRFRDLTILHIVRKGKMLFCKNKQYVQSLANMYNMGTEKMCNMITKIMRNSK